MFNCKEKLIFMLRIDTIAIHIHLNEILKTFFWGLIQNPMCFTLAKLIQYKNNFKLIKYLFKYDF